MKILHVPYSFYPDPVGGTEVYVAALARHLQQLQYSVVVAAPGRQDDSYEYRGIPVRRYTVSAVKGGLRDLYGEGDESAARAFGKILEAERPDMLHLHAFTRGVSLRLVRTASARGIPVVFTYHTPTVTCQRGTMMRWGTECCDGLMDLHSCTRCTIDGLFVGRRYNQQDAAIQKRTVRVTRSKAEKVVAHLIGSLPATFGSRLGQYNLQGTHWTALRMTELVQLRHTAVRALLSEVKHVVAVCQWVKEVLILNGVPERKITLCRQGVAEESGIGRPKLEQFSRDRHSPLRIAFLGRFDPAKGVHILIQAVRSVPGLSLRLDIYGVRQDEGGQYERELRRMAAADARIEFHRPVAGTQVISTLRNYDLLAVPSQCLETGPLVVLEAFAAGVPVIGSQLGGIAELVRNGVDGVLIAAGDVDRWAITIRRLCEDTSLIERLRKNISPPRRMSSVASEMAALYEHVQAQHGDPGHQSTVALSN